MNGITFTVPAVPIAQPRPRATRYGKHARVYAHSKDHPVASFKAAVQMAFAAAYRGPPLEGPLTLSAVFVFPRPKSKVWKLREMLRDWHIGRSDLDNHLKSLKDALEGLAYRNDAQVVAYLEPTCKQIATGSESAHVAVTIRKAGKP